MFNDEIQVWNWVRNNGNEKRILSNPMKFYSFLSHRVSWLSRFCCTYTAITSFYEERKKECWYMRQSLADSTFRRRNRSFYVSVVHTFVTSVFCFLFSPGGRGRCSTHLTARLKIANSSTYVVDAPARGARLAFWFCPVFLRFAALNRRSKHVVARVRCLFSLSNHRRKALRAYDWRVRVLVRFFFSTATNSRWGGE